MSSGFVHSVKVPRFYKVIARTVQTVEEEGTSLKQLIYEKKHPNLLGTYALALTTIQHGPQLDELLRKTQLLLKESRLDPWLARVLITELLWGKKCLSSESKPVKTILSYKRALDEQLKNLDKTGIKTVVNGNKVQKPRYVRINTLVSTVKDSIRSFTDDGWTLLPKCRNYPEFLKTLANLNENTFIQDYHIPELFAFPPGTRFHDHPGYQCGAIVLQDKASCLPAYLLNASPGSTVLDMCSAPGMKTTHLAAIMKNTGKIIAVERDIRRYNTLCEMIKTNAAHCVTTVNADAMKLKPEECAGIEYILVDPSCSGSGMLNRINLGNENSRCAPGRLISLQSFQVLLLRHALLNFPTVKRVVYSTCSMYPEENEMVVDEILENIGDAYNLIPVRNLIGPDWINFSSPDYKCKKSCLYARPDVDMSNGFFVAVFERNFDVSLPEYQRRGTAVKLHEEDKVTSKQRKIESGSQLGKKKNPGSESRGELNNGSKITETKEESLTDEIEVSNMVDTGRKLVHGGKRESKTGKQDLKSVPDDEPQEKIKKRRRKQPEIIQMDEPIVVEVSTAGDQLLYVSEKGKKKKKPLDVEPLEINQMPDIPTDQMIKNKKKKKKCLDAATSLISPTVDTFQNKKGKKRKSDRI